MNKNNEKFLKIIVIDLIFKLILRQLSSFNSAYIVEDLEFSLDGRKIILFQLFLIVGSVLGVFEFELLSLCFLVELLSFEFED